jgi:hypothetical protein
MFLGKHYRFGFSINNIKNMNKQLFPIHPGEILLEDFMKPLSITQYHLAQDIGESPICRAE